MARKPGQQQIEKPLSGPNFKYGTFSSPVSEMKYRKLLRKKLVEELPTLFIRNKKCRFISEAKYFCHTTYLTLNDRFFEQILFTALDLVIRMRAFQKGSSCFKSGVSDRFNFANLDGV